MIIILKPNNKKKHERRDQGIKDQDQSDEGECLNPKPIPRPLTSNHPRIGSRSAKGNNSRLMSAPLL